jgi:hypothetical protein
LFENGYMAQPRGFVIKRKEGMPPIEISYELEQISRQWHLKLKCQLRNFGLKKMRGQLRLYKVME